MAAMDSKNRENDRLVEINEVRQRAGGKSKPVSRRTIERWRAAGSFPKSIVIGGQVRWWLSEIEIWLDARTAARDIQSNNV